MASEASEVGNEDVTNLAPFGLHAGGRGRWYHYFLGLFCMALLVVAISGLLSLIWNRRDVADPAKRYFEDHGVQNAPALGHAAAELMLFIAGFGSICLALVFVTAIVQDRPVTSLFTRARSPRWRYVGLSVILGCVAVAVATAVEQILGLDKLEFVLDPVSFGPFVVASVIWLPIQVGAEELLLRSYLYQFGCVILRRPLPSIVACAAMFSSLHYWNPEVERFGLAILFDLFLVGLYAGWISYRTGGIEHAIGLHIAINFMAFHVFTYDEKGLLSPSLWLYRDPSFAYSTGLALIILGTHYALMRGTGQFQEVSANNNADPPASPD